MINFTKNKRTGRFDVIGPVSELRVGNVIVTKKDGSTSEVEVLRLSRPFVAKFGPNEGKECVIGTVADRRTDHTSQYCGYPCPVTGLKCCPENGPCHDCA